MTSLVVREIVDRSGLRYAAAAGVMAGGMLVGGPGIMIALADTGGVGQHDSDRSHQGNESARVARENRDGAQWGSWRRGDGPPQGRPWGYQPGGDNGLGGGTGRHSRDPCEHGGGSGGDQPPPGGGGPSLRRPRGFGGLSPPVIVFGPPQPPLPGLVELGIVGPSAVPVKVPVPGPPVLMPPPVALPPAPEVGVGTGPSVALAQGALGAPPNNTPGAPPNNTSPLTNETLGSAREPVPAQVGLDIGLPESVRAGYSEYLRTAGMAQMAAVAVPGLAGILLLTAGGGFIGYRQAKADHLVRTEGIARYLR
jgi:hypothetical protein